MQVSLEIPAKALNEIQRQLDQHNESTGAELELLPYLKRVILEVAGMPAMQEAIPIIEAARDRSHQIALNEKQADIIDSFADPAP